MGTTNLEWFQNAFHGISHDDDIVNRLSDTKIALSALNSNQLKYTSSSLNLTCIFDCLNSSDKKQIDTACAVLKVSLNSLEPSVILRQYGAAMLRALRHPNAEVKELVLEELNRAVCESDLAPALGQEAELLLSVVECVALEERSVAQQSIKFLVRLGCTTAGLSALYSPTNLQALMNVSISQSGNRDIYRYRVYEIAVDVSANSRPGLEATHATGLLQRLCEEVKADDMLVMLSALECVTKLALTHHGNEYLETHKVIEYLAHQLAEGLDTHIMGYLAVPGLIKFFGNIAQLRPQESFEKYPIVFVKIINSIGGSDQNLACIALETIGYIATTPAGKLTLNKHGMMIKVMQKLVEVILKWPSEFRVRGMNTLANTLRVEVSDQDTELLGVVKGWFDAMGPAPRVMAEVMTLAQQPFPDIKLAVLLLLRVLAEQPWGQQYILQTPGLVEVLLDRGSDSIMEEKSSRFAVINTLSESPNAEAVFGEELVKRFKHYTREGAVYVRADTEVAIERAE